MVSKYELIQRGGIPASEYKLSLQAMVVHSGRLMTMEGAWMVMPGDDVELEAELITPIAMEKELRFAIREGGRTVGAGVVTEILE